MKNKFIAFLLAFVMVFGMVFNAFAEEDIFTGLSSQADETEEYACNCEYPPESGNIADHNDSCVRKTYIKSLIEGQTAEEIYAAWDTYDDALRTDLLIMLQLWDSTKYEALTQLIQADQTSEREITVGGTCIQVSGVIPETVSLWAETVEDDQYADAMFEAYGDSFTAIRAFDIKLLAENASEWQPDNGQTVTVSLDAESRGMQESEEFYVIHLHNDATRILGPFMVENGISAFETDGFSIFVLASGNTTLGAEARKDFLTMNPGNAFGKERSYYVMPGTTITFYAPEGKSIAWTPQSTNDLNLQSSNGSVYVVTVSPTAAVGSKSVIQANSCSATITVSSKETIVNMALTDNGVNNMSGLYFTCLTDPHNGLPAEPGVNTRTFKIIRSNYTIHIANGSNTGYTSFSGGTNPAQFIDASIANALEFVTNADGTCTLGLVDYTGKEIKKYLKNINFYTALQKLAAAGSVYAVDGIKITSNNYSGYTLIPYVLKLQTVSGFSWNLDCYIVPNSNFAVLSYNFNMPVDRYISDAYTVPSPFTSIYNVNTKQWQYAAVDRVFQVNGQYNLYDNTGNTYYPYIFKGWATSASGNVVYNPGDQVYVDKDMTLYAVWVEATADLTVTKSGCNEALDADQAFLFQITDENGKLITEITVHGNGSTTIKGLKAGRKYTVTELTDWSWRYEFCSWQFVSDDAADTKGSTNHAAVTLGTSGNTITFTNTRDEVKWLDGDTCRDNLFNKN